MGLFLKYLVKNNCSKQNIFRTLLSILALAISATLFSGSMLFVTSLISQYDEYIKRQYGEFNVKIESEGEISKQTLEEISKDIEKKITFQETTVRPLNTQDQHISFVGFEKEEMKQLDFCSFILDENSNEQPENWCYISVRTAKEQNLSLGDSISFLLDNGRRIHLKIIGMADNTFVFTNDTALNYSVILSQNVYNDFFADANSCEYCYMQTNVKDVDQWIVSFNEEHEDATVSRTYDRNNVDMQIFIVSVPLFFILGIVVLCCIFIISSAYRMLLMSRIHEMGIFMSQGISFRKLISGLIFESGLQGIISGILGGIVGNILCLKMLRDSNPLEAYGVVINYRFSVEYILIAALFTCMLGIGVIVLICLKLRFCSVKDVLFNMVYRRKGSKAGNGIAGLILTGISLLLNVISENLGMPALVCSIVGAYLVSSFLVRIIYDICNKAHIFNNAKGTLLLGEISNSKVLISDLSVLVVCLSLIFLLHTLSYEMSNLIRNGYSSIYFDSYVQVLDERKQDVQEILEKQNYFVHETNKFNGYLNGDRNKVLNIMCVEPEKYKEFENYIVFADKNKELNQLDQASNGIIVSEQVARTYSITKGDRIYVAANDGRLIELEVISICNPRMWDGGNYNLITRKAASELFHILYPDTYYIESEVTSEELNRELNVLLKDYDKIIYTKQELISYEESNLKQIAGMMDKLTYMIFVFCVFSLVGNMILSIKLREKEWALLDIIGAEKTFIRNLFCAETIFKVLFAFVLAFLYSHLMIWSMTNFLHSIGFAMNLFFQLKTSMFLFLVLFICYLLSSIVLSKRIQNEKITQFYNNI